MVDLTRLRKNAEKKNVSVSVAHIKHTDVSATTLNEIFMLPANALIINAGVIVDVAGQGGLTVDLGFDGGAEMGDDLAISTTGYKQIPLALDGNAATFNNFPRLLTGTGKTVTAKFSADPSAGEFYFLVEYIEFKRGNGELTNFGSAG